MLEEHPIFAKDLEDSDDDPDDDDDSPDDDDPLDDDDITDDADDDVVDAPPLPVSSTGAVWLLLVLERNLIERLSLLSLLESLETRISSAELPTSSNSDRVNSFPSVDVGLLSFAAVLALFDCDGSILYLQPNSKVTPKLKYKPT